MKTIIFGAGFIGLYFSDLIQSAGRQIICIMDNNPQKWGKYWNDTIPIVSPASIDNKADKVVIAILDNDAVFRSIRSQLEEIGFSDIEHIFEFANEPENEEIFSNQRIILNTTLYNKCIKAVTFDDVKSTQTFNSIQKVLERQEKTVNGAEYITNQYFIPDVFKYLEYDRILDIGAGPQLELLFELKKRNMQVGQYIAVDPIMQPVNEESVSTKFVYKAVDEKPGNLFVKDYNGTNALVSDQPEIGLWKNTQTITLDEIGNEYEPSIIKIDTEGFEKRIISGGLKYLKANRPILEIACYHCYEDFFVIPRMIKDIYDTSYNYYLRSYQGISETIFYAVPKERKNEIS